MQEDKNIDPISNKNFYTVVLTLSATAFITLLNVHSINVALATIAMEFGISEAKVALIPQSYLIMLCSFMLVVGKLANILNPKQMFLGGLIVFTVTSIFCGLSENFETLVAWRAIQGVSAAVLQAVGMMLLIRTIPQGLRGKAFGINGMFASLGLLIGAPLGGIITSAYGWQSAFFICIPACVLCIFMAITFLPNIPADTSSQKWAKIDIKGALLSMVTLSLLIYVLYLGAEDGWQNSVVILQLCICAVLCGWLYYHLRTHDNPILDLRLFSSRKFVLSLAVIFIANLMLTGNNFVIPFYLVDIHHMEAQQIGLMFLFFSIAYLLISPLAGFLTDKISSRRTIIIGIMVCIVAYSLFVFSLSLKSLFPVSVFLFLIGGGLSLTLTSSNVLTFEDIESNNVGESTALYRLIGLLGAAIGVNLFSSLLTSNVSNKFCNFTAFHLTYGVSLLLGVIMLTLILNIKKKKI